MLENEISYLIRGAIFKVYNAYGPGLLESAYEAMLMHVLQKQGLKVQQQVVQPLIFEEAILQVGYRLDLLVADKVIVELKSVDQILEIHHKQLLTYLKISGKKLGLLVNFNSADISTAIHRKVNNL